MSTQIIDNTKVEVDYEVEPVRDENKRVTHLKIRQITTTTQLSESGRKKRNSEHEWDFTDLVVIDVKDVPDLVSGITNAFAGALHDLERGLV